MPAKKPAALSVLHGDRASRISKEPQPPRGVPAAPDYISGEAEEIWYYTIKQLIPTRTLTHADRDALAVYCESVALHREASRQIGIHGILSSEDSKHPAIQVQRDAASTIKSFAIEFGLTPKARASIKVTETDDRDERERLLS